MRYSDDYVTIELPDSVDVLSAPKAEPLPDPGTAIQKSLNCPIASASLSELAKNSKTAAVVVSDNTRPVPYKGPDGILPPIIEALKKSSVEHITVIIACGTHREMAEQEIKNMLGDCVFAEGVKIINHIR